MFQPKEKYIMILVFGGTTEGKKVAHFLEELNLSYTYTTKTKIKFEGKGTYIYGAMEPSDIANFCKKNKITHIINAAHPFAENLHNNIITADIDIPKIRYERIFLERINHPLVNYLSTFEEALAYLKRHNFQRLLALSGVNTIQKLAPYWQKHTAWFRILDRDESRTVALAANFPLENLLYGFPQETSEEIKLFNLYKPEVIITKESGVNGKLQQKINAATATQTPIIIIKKPTLSSIYLQIKSIKKLKEILLT